MKIKTMPTEIFTEYQKCVDFNTRINLYDEVKQNENFFIGKQWEGLNAPDLDRPVLNFLKRVGTYSISMLATDAVGISVAAQQDDDYRATVGRILETEVQTVVEDAKLVAKNREHLRDCYVDGDAFAYFFYDIESTRIDSEIVDNTDVNFANPCVQDIQKQPYIIIARHMLLDTVRDRAEGLGIDPDSIRPDDDDPYRDDDDMGQDRVTVLLKLWKQNGANGAKRSVHFCEVTRDTVLRPDTDTGYTLYPIAGFSWEKVKRRWHGQSGITGLIPNQIAVNKLWAMALRHQHMMAFPKIFYDSAKIKQWNNRVGEAIGVAGNPNDAVAANFRAADMSAQLTDIVDRTITMTKDFMGASDAALGNVKPDNTSAIIAVQKASSAPLEMQRLAFYQFVEDYVRIILELIVAHYGVRDVRVSDNGEPQTETINFGEIDLEQIDWRVDVGTSSYWNELTQMQTLDNMFASGILTDAVTYLECLPEGYIKNKNKIIEQLKAQRESEMQMQQAAVSAQTGGFTPGAAAVAGADDFGAIDAANQLIAMREEQL